MEGLVQIIGVDCATDPKKTGLCRAEYCGGKLHVHEALRGSDELPVVDCLSRWIAGSECVLIGVDAPLGWPDPLRRVLEGHRAGQPTGENSRTLFSRHTDAFIQAQPRFGKWPLEVGANFIARTANHALAMLDELRGRLGRPVELAWCPEEVDGIKVIEVYPWATLVARGIHVPSYKLKRQTEARGMLLEALECHRVEMCESVAEACLASADVFDAVVAALATADFLSGYCDAPAPKDFELARREGWIWVAGGD